MQTMGGVNKLALGVATRNNTQLNSNKLNETSTKENVMLAQTEMPIPVVPSLASSASIVTLNRSMVELKSNDPYAAEALAKLKKANPKSVKVMKELIVSPAYKRLKSFSDKIYRYHIRATVPWGDLGARLLPNLNKPDYKNKLELELMPEFNRLKQEFLRDYPRARLDAGRHLGELYDDSLFPSVGTLDSRIGIKVEYDFIADPANFFVQVGDHAARETKQQYESLIEARLGKVSEDMCTRLQEPLTNLVKQISYGDTDKPTGFHDTLVDNVASIVDLLGTCNFNNNPAITTIKTRLRGALRGVTPDGLRTSATLRERTKEDVQAIIESIPSLDF
jgi:hypothetical protein